MMNGYQEASKIEHELCDLLEKHPIEGNGAEWWRLTRTLRTTLDLLEHDAKADIGDATLAEAGWVRKRWDN